MRVLSFWGVTQPHTVEFFPGIFTFKRPKMVAIQHLVPVYIRLRFMGTSAVTAPFAQAFRLLVGKSVKNTHVVWQS